MKTRLSKKDDLPQYTNLLQTTYQDAYSDEKLGFGKELFSKDVFSSKDTQSYLTGNLKVSDMQKTWLVFDKEKLIASVTVDDKGEEFELRGFYVLPGYQGKGVGKKLWKKVLGFAKDKDITLDIYSHNTKTIEIYKKWGFVVDKEMGKFFRHWPEWPNGVRAKCIYMRYKH